MLSDDQVRTFADTGLLMLEQRFSKSEVSALRSALDLDATHDGEHRVAEDDLQSTRAVYAPHLRDPLFRRLAEHELTLGSALDATGSSLYLYQYKVNTKRAFGGGAWVWHQDYIAWRIQDGLPRPDAITATVFLDEVNEFNGPMIFIPGSHRRGEIAPPTSSASTAEHFDPVDFELSPAQVTSLANDGGLEAPKGPAGSILLFDPNVVHASQANISPWQRDLVLISYCAVGNTPTRETPRPEFLVNRSREALTRSPDPLLALAAR